MSEPAALDHADRPKRYVWRVSARGIAWIRKIFRARENVLRCIAAARKKSGIGVILSEVDDFVVCELIAIGLSTYLQNQPSGTLNHDSYVECDKYLGQAYFPVSARAEK